MQPEHFAMGSNEFISFYEQENSCKKEGIEENCILHLKLYICQYRKITLKTEF